MSDLDEAPAAELLDIAGLVSLAEHLGLEPYDLDRAIQEQKAYEASLITESGLAAQIACIAAFWNHRQVEMEGILEGLAQEKREAEKKEKGYRCRST